MVRQNVGTIIVRLLFVLVCLMNQVHEVTSFLFASSSGRVGVSTRLGSAAVQQSTNNIIPLTSPRFNGSFESFLGAEDLCIISSGTSAQGGVYRSFFQPRQIANATDRELWQWWQERKMTERVLKSAVGSSKRDIRRYFDALKPFLLAEKAEILQANDDFFQAILRGDPDLMSSLWHASNETVCVLPGTDFCYTGTSAILAHWHTTLAAPKPNLQVRGIKLNFQGDVAVVTCTMENSLRPRKRPSGAGAGSGAGNAGFTAALITNIFVRPPGSDRYFLTAHVGSVSPATERRATLTALRRTYMDPSRVKRRQQGGEFGSFRSGGGMGMGGPSFGYQPLRLDDLMRQVTGAGKEGDGEDEDDEEGDEEGYEGDDGDDEDGDEEGDEEDDEEDEGDEGEWTVDDDAQGGNNIRDKVRSRFLQAIGAGAGAGAGGRGGSGPRVFILKGSNLEPQEQFFGPRAGAGRGNGKDSSGKDSSSDDDEASAEEEDELSRVLASRTLQTVAHLANQGRLSQALKKQITRDVIKSVSSGKFSKAEVAFSLVIGPGRPEDALGQVRLTEFAANDVKEEDMADFAALLHQL